MQRKTIACTDVRWLMIQHSIGKGSLNYLKKSILLPLTQMKSYALGIYAPFFLFVFFHFHMLEDIDPLLSTFIYQRHTL